MISRYRGVEVRFQYLVYLLRPTALGTSGGLTMQSAVLAVAYDSRRPGY